MTRTPAPAADDDPVAIAERLDTLWDEARAAIIVRQRVDTPEVRAEVKRAINALISAMLHDDDVVSMLAHDTS